MNDEEMSKKLLNELRPKLDDQWNDHKKLLDLIAASAETPDQKKTFEAYLRKRAGYAKRTYVVVAKYVLIGIIVCLGLTLLFLVVHRW